MMWGGKISFKVPMLFSIRISVSVSGCGAYRDHVCLSRHGTGYCTTIISSSRIFTTCWWALSYLTFLPGSIIGIPKLTGRMINETLGKWHFWLFLIGFHMTFYITGILVGMEGMPRSIYTYEADRGWDASQSDHIHRRIHPGDRSSHICLQPLLVVSTAVIRRAMTPGMRGRSNGQRPRLHLSITSPWNRR